MELLDAPLAPAAPLSAALVSLAADDTVVLVALLPLQPPESTAAALASPRTISVAGRLMLAPSPMDGRLGLWGRYTTA
jgi:hypothetical protein